jgi:hypothetical protein
MGHAVAQGGLNVAEMALKSLNVLGGALGHDFGAASAMERLSRYRNSVAWDDPSKEYATSKLRKFVVDSISNFTTSGAGMILGAAAGGALGGPAGAVWGMWAGGRVGMYSTVPMFGLSEYYDFMKEAKDAGLQEDDVRDDAILSAVVESGMELASDLIFDKLFLRLPKGGVAAPAKTAFGRTLQTTEKALLDKPGVQNFLKAYIPRYLATVGEEVPTEMIQSYANYALREHAGMEQETPIDEVLGETMLTTAGTSVLFGLSGMGGTVMRGKILNAKKRANELKDTIPDVTDSRPVTGDQLQQIQNEVTGPLRDAYMTEKEYKKAKGGRQKAIDNYNAFVIESKEYEQSKGGVVLVPPGYREITGDFDETTDTVAHATKVISGALSSVQDKADGGKKAKETTREIVERMGMHFGGAQPSYSDAPPATLFTEPLTGSTLAVEEGAGEYEVLDSLQRHFMRWDMPHKAKEMLDKKRAIIKTGYEKVPDSLMGFAKPENQQKGFEETKFPYSIGVKVTWDDGTVHEDVIKGMNENHALERAKRNWDDASKIEVTSRTIEPEVSTEFATEDTKKLRPLSSVFGSGYKFHGTDIENINGIVSNGLNPRSSVSTSDGQALEYPVVFVFDNMDTQDVPYEPGRGFSTQRTKPKAIIVDSSQFTTIRGEDAITNEIESVLTKLEDKYGIKSENVFASLDKDVPREARDLVRKVRVLNQEYDKFTELGEQSPKKILENVVSKSNGLPVYELVRNPDDYEIIEGVRKVSLDKPDTSISTTISERPAPEETEAYLTDMANVIGKAVKGVRVEFVGDQEMQEYFKIADPDKFQAAQAAGKSIRGLYSSADNAIILNKDIATRTTVPHEFGHAVLRWMRVSKAPGYEQLTKLVTNTAYAKEVVDKFSKGDKKIVDVFANSIFGEDYSKLSTEYKKVVNESIQEEMLAHAIGDRGKQLHEGAKNQLMYTLNKVWHEVKTGVKNLLGKEWTFDDWINDISYNMRKPGYYDVSRNKTGTYMVAPELGGEKPPAPKKADKKMFEDMTKEEQETELRAQMQGRIIRWSRNVNMSEEDAKAIYEKATGKSKLSDMNLDEMSKARDAIAVETTNRYKEMSKKIRVSEERIAGTPEGRSFSKRLLDRLRRKVAPLANGLYPESPLRWKWGKDVSARIVMSAMAGEAGRAEFFNKKLESIDKSVGDMVAYLSQYDRETNDAIIAVISGTPESDFGQISQNMYRAMLEAKHPELLDGNVLAGAKELYNYNFRLMQYLETLIEKEPTKASTKLFYGRYERAQSVGEQLRKFLGVSNDVYVTSDSFFERARYKSYADAIAAGNRLKEPNVFRNLLDETAAISNMIAQAELRDYLMKTNNDKSGSKFIVRRGWWVDKLMPSPEAAARLGRPFVKGQFKFFADKTEALDFIKAMQKESTFGKAKDEAREIVKRIKAARQEVKDRIVRTTKELVDISPKRTVWVVGKNGKKYRRVVRGRGIAGRKMLIEQEVTRITREGKVVVKQLQVELKEARKRAKAFNLAYKETASEYTLGDQIEPPTGWEMIGKVTDPVWNGEYFAEPTMARVINNNLTINQVTHTSAANQVRKIATTMRWVKFSMSTFHYGTVTKQVIADAGGFMGFLNPEAWATKMTKTGYKFGLKDFLFSGHKLRDMFYQDPEAKAIYEDLLRHGLTPIGRVSSSTMEREAFGHFEGVLRKLGFEALYRKAPNGLKTVLDIAAGRRFNSWLFEYYIPTLQAARAITEVTRVSAKLGTPLTSAQKLEIVKQGMFLEGEVNEKIYGRTGTMTSLLRFPFFAPGFAEGNMQTIYASMSKWGDAEGQGARARWAVLNSFAISAVLAAVGTAVFTKKWPKFPEDEDELRDSFKIDTGEKDYKGRTIMIDLLTFDKDYWEIYSQVFFGRPHRIPAVVFKRLGNMHSGVVAFTRDFIDISEGRSVIDWKGDKVYHLTDPFLVKLAKYSQHAGDELKPISWSVFTQAKQRKLNNMVSFLEAAAGVRSVTSEKDRKEMEWVRNLFDMREKREEQFRYLEREGDPRKTLLYYNREVERAMADKNMPASMQEEFNSLLIDVDSYVGYTINRLKDPSLSKAQRARLFDILANFKISPAEYRTYVVNMRRTRAKKAKLSRIRNERLRRMNPELMQYNY